MSNHRNVEVKRAGVGRICVRDYEVASYLNRGFVLANEEIENNVSIENPAVVDTGKVIAAPYDDHLLELLEAEVKKRELLRGVNIIVHEPRNKAEFVTALEEDDEDPKRWS